MNICIVDDDKYVVEKIVEGMEWKRWDIDGVYVAYNIKQAKDILSTLQIDILLSDIEMPQGSGLELLEWVREKQLPVECIYLSSYAHFAYAQKALELHSRGYLLKPVSNRELGRVLEELAGQMKQAGGERRNNSNRDKERFWRDFLLEKEEEEEAQAYYGKDSLTLCLLRIFHKIEHKKTQNHSILYLSLGHMAEEFLNDHGFSPDVIWRYSDESFLIVLKNCRKDRESFQQGIGELLSGLEEELDIPACVYVGKPSGIDGAGMQMDGLRQMMVEGVPGMERVLFFDGWRGRDALYEPPDFALWEKKMMQSQDMGEVSREIEEYVDKLWERGGVNVGVFGRFKADLQQMIFHYMMENGIAMNQIFETGEFDYYCEKASWTLEAMKDFVSILFKKLKAVIKAENTEENVVEQIMRYIDENLGGDLSRAKLAAKAYISEDYLSKKFAMHTGMSIPNYVSARRMEKAQDYFKNTSRSVSEVAMLVGYTNFSYFSKTFRDYAGCTPNEFRNRNNINN